MTDTLAATIRFGVDTGTKPEFYQSYVPGEVTQHTGTSEPHEVAIADARRIDHMFTLDVEGFQLAKNPTRVKDFYDDDEVRRVYNPEIEAIVANAIGARRTVCFDHTRRSSSAEIRTRHAARDPAGIAHNDYTDWSADKRLGEIMGEEAAALKQRRFTIVNTWRTIAGPVEHWPMALCDATTARPDRILKVTRRTDDRIGETMQALFDPGQKWYWFPHLQPDEILLIKTYDSAPPENENGVRTPFSLHTAFDNPLAGPDAPPRESIESRLFAFF
ncbi:MAG: CmcJ/NvfI family oxidoreductase [Alphaproteobacteria bacterium]|jgi:hypothetical protein